MVVATRTFDIMFSAGC